MKAIKKLKLQRGKYQGTDGEGTDSQEENPSRDSSDKPPSRTAVSRDNTTTNTNNMDPSSSSLSSPAHLAASPTDPVPAPLLKNRSQERGKRVSASATTTSRNTSAGVSPSAAGSAKTTGMKPLMPLQRGPGYHRRGEDEYVHPEEKKGNNESNHHHHHNAPNRSSIGPSQPTIPPVVSPPPPPDADAVRPSQFSRALQLINGLVLNEWNTIEAEEGRGKKSGWTSVWTSGGDMGHNAGSSHHRSYTGVEKAKEESFKLQAVWLLTDGETLAVIDFNGTAEHHNYKDSMRDYLNQLSTSGRGGGDAKGRRKNDGAYGTDSSSSGTGGQQRSPSPHLSNLSGSEDAENTQQESNVVTWLSVDFTSDFTVGSTMPVAPSLLAALNLTTHRDRQRWTIRGSTSRLDHHTFLYGKPKALMIVLRGRLLVQSVLEEMCNGYMPPFMEDAYENGVRLEGRWCLPQAPHPGGGVSAETPRQTAVAGTMRDGSAAVVHRLWRPDTLATTGAEVPAAVAAVWNDLFPAVEAQRRHEAHDRQLGVIAVPRVLLDELNAFVAQFPRYTPFAAAKAPACGAAHGVPLPPPLGSTNAEDADGAPPQSFIFTGRGTRLGGTLGEADARRRVVASAQHSAAASCSSLSGGVPSGTGAAASGDSNALLPSERSASSPADGVHLLPLSPNGEVPSTVSISSVPYARGGSSGLAAMRRADELTHVSALSATGPTFKQVWQQYQQAATQRSQSRERAVEHKNKEEEQEVQDARHAKRVETTSSSSKRETSVHNSADAPLVAPGLCQSVLVYTPHGKIRLERALPIHPLPQKHNRSTPAGGAGSTTALPSTAQAKYASTLPSTTSPYMIADGDRSGTPNHFTPSLPHPHAPTEVQLLLPMVTIKDCKNSLLRSALGRSLRLNKDNIQFIFAPGTPVLSEDMVLHSNEAVLRLLTRRKSC